MAADSSAVAMPAVSSITETRYCISGSSPVTGAPLAGGRSLLLRTPLPRSDTASRFLSTTFACNDRLARVRVDHRRSRDRFAPSCGPRRRARPVDECREARPDPAAVDELQRSREFAGREDPLAVTGEEGVDDHPQLVHQPVLPQRVHELSAAVHHDLAV